jgi:hypothetical protein
VLDIITKHNGVPELAEDFGANERELRALDEFIAYKERCVERF